MGLALYCPVYGYYEKEPDRIGRGGDYYTSVSVGSLFGELLAFQFAEWLEESGGTWIVEAGAHDGKLARDILGWLRERRSKLFEKVEYCMLESSDQRQSWQKQALGEFVEKVIWARELGDLDKIRPSPGVIFSNEFLDAFPMRRFSWAARERKWFESGVGVEGGNFVWRTLATNSLSQQLNHSILSDSKVLDLLPDGFIIEWSPTAERWLTDAAKTLQPGSKLVTIDYGFETEELLSRAQTHGTLRAYANHRISADLLANPGEQDLTAHVNFSAIKRAGEEAGLKTEAFLSQGQFLTQIASRTWNASAAFGTWNPERRRQFQTLTHPEHLGRAFRVLVQAREQ